MALGVESVVAALTERHPPRPGIDDARRAVGAAAGPRAALGGELCTLQLLCTLHVQSLLVGAE